MNDNTRKIINYPSSKDLKLKREFGSQSHFNSRNGFCKAIKVINLKGECLIDYRVYWSEAGNCKVLLWTSGDNSFSTSAKATGYGYHKESSALAIALYGANIQFNMSINGVGDEAIDEALMLVAKKLAKKRQKLILVKTHE